MMHVLNARIPSLLPHTKLHTYEKKIPEIKPLFFVLSFLRIHSRTSMVSTATRVLPLFVVSRGRPRRSPFHSALPAIFHGSSRCPCFVSPVSASDFFRVRIPSFSPHHLPCFWLVAIRNLASSLFPTFLLVASFTAVDNLFPPRHLSPGTSLLLIFFRSLGFSCPSTHLTRTHTRPGSPTFAHLTLCLCESVHCSITSLASAGSALTRHNRTLFVSSLYPPPPFPSFLQCAPGGQLGRPAARLFLLCRHVSCRHTPGFVPKARASRTLFCSVRRCVQGRSYGVLSSAFFFTLPSNDRAVSIVRIPAFRQPRSF